MGPHRELKNLPSQAGGMPSRSQSIISRKLLSASGDGRSKMRANARARLVSLLFFTLPSYSVSVTMQSPAITPHNTGVSALRTQPLEDQTGTMSAGLQPRT